MWCLRAMSLAEEGVEFVSVAADGDLVDRCGTEHRISLQEGAICEEQEAEGGEWL